MHACRIAAAVIGAAWLVSLSALAAPLGAGQSAGPPPIPANDAEASGTGSAEDAVADGESGGEIVDGSDPERLADIIRDVGYRAIVDTDSVGDPMIVSRMAGVNTSVLFDLCVEHADCSVARFSTRFVQREAVDRDLVDEWNRSKLLARAYIDDEGNAVLLYDLNLAGGITADNFRAAVEWWDTLLNEFKQHIGF